jgi:hypothetical protein
MFIKYLNQEGEISALFNSDDIGSIGRNVEKKEVVIRFKSISGSTSVVTRLPMNNLAEVQKVLTQLSEVLAEAVITSEISETEELDKLI